MFDESLQGKKNKSNVELIRINKNATIAKTKYKFSMKNCLLNQKSSSLIDNEINVLNTSLLTGISTGIVTLTESKTIFLTNLNKLIS